jgi:hypothetical protein
MWNFMTAVPRGIVMSGRRFWEATSRPSRARVSLRVNLLGFAVAQIDLAHPFQRPTRNWAWASA